MSQFQRMEKLKLAASMVIETLNAGDYFAVVEFDNKARQLGNNDNMLLSARENSKNRMKGAVKALSPNGGTNYFNGFKKAFDIFKASPTQDLTSNCKQAILFVSDGAMNDSPAELYKMIDSERQEYIDKGKKPPVIFTYSFGADAPETVPKELSCRYDGVWARISDTGDLSGSMGAYYKYFSYGLSDGVNGDFVSWVPPYRFSTGNLLGTTVSAPVYNRNLDPPILVGVVGMDFSFLAMEKVLNDESDEGRDAIIEEIVATNRARCPVFALDSCQKDSLRKFGGLQMEDEATCDECTNQIQNFQSPLCDDATKTKVHVWNNEKTKFWSNSERICCNVGEVRDGESMTQTIARENMCEERNKDVLYIALIASGAGILAIVLFLFLCRKCKSKRAKEREINYEDNPPPVVPLAVPSQHK